MLRTFRSAFVSAVATTLGAQPSLLLDINTVPGSAMSSSPGGFAASGPGAFFAATTRGRGRELWFTDAQGAALRTDLQPGPIGSSPRALTPLAVGLVLVAGLTQSELWFVSAGGATRLSSGLEVSGLVRSGQRVFFVGTDAARGSELWVTDGTVAGTRLVADVVPGPGSPLIAKMLPYQGGLAMTLDDGVHGMELWVTDGTLAGTRLLHDLNPGPGVGVGFPHDVVEHGGALFFSGDDGTTGSELWATDGVQPRLVADVQPGATSSYPGSLTSLGSELAFVAYDPSLELGQAQPWISHGSTATTQRLTTELVSRPCAFTRLPTGAIVFVTVRGEVEALAVTDGTPNGTRLMPPFSVGTHVSGLHLAGDRIYVLAQQLFVVRHVNNGAVALTPTDAVVGPDLAVFPDGSAFFTAEHRSHGAELWRSDGTPSGTALFADLEPFSTTLGSQPRVLTTIAGRAVLVAVSMLGAQLWATDGTAPGTVPLASVGVEVHLLDNLQGVAILRDERGVIRTDGTPAGTLRLNTTASLHLYQRPAVALDGGRVVFGGSTAAGSQLWISDGTAAGTRVLVDMQPDHATQPYGFVRVGNLALFAAADDAHGWELWSTDGTLAGTRLLADVYPGPANSYPTYVGMVAGRAVFMAESPTSGLEPWISDGTPAGTQLLADISPGAANTVLGVGVRAGARLVFPANTQTWSTDGTAQGTFQILPFTTQGVALRDRAVLLAAQIGGNHVMYRTDGTVAGTVAENYPFPGGTVHFDAIAADVAMLSIGNTGRTAWFTTNGTAAGTRACGQVGFGPPMLSATLGGRALATLDDGEHGNELWLVDGGAAARVDGVGCGVHADRVALTGSAPRLGSLVQLSVTHSNRAAAILVGLPAEPPHPVALPARACALFVDLTGPWFSLVADSAGDVLVPIPNDANLIGAVLGAQALSGLNAAVQWELSPGLRLTLAQ